VVKGKRGIHFVRPERQILAGRTKCRTRRGMRDGSRAKRLYLLRPFAEKKRGKAQMRKRAGDSSFRKNSLPKEMGERRSRGNSSIGKNTSAERAYSSEALLSGERKLVWKRKKKKEEARGPRSSQKKKWGRWRDLHRRRGQQRRARKQTPEKGT